MYVFKFNYFTFTLRGNFRIQGGNIIEVLNKGIKH